MFSCEFSKIFENSSFYKTLLVITSESPMFMKENPDRKKYTSKLLSFHLCNSLLHSGFFSHLLKTDNKLSLLHFVNTKSTTVYCTIIFIVLDAVLPLWVTNWNVEGISLLQIHLKTWFYVMCILEPVHIFRISWVSVKTTSCFYLLMRDFEIYSVSKVVSYM